jgi:hypothetical protein
MMTSRPQIPVDPGTLGAPKSTREMETPRTVNDAGSILGSETAGPGYATSNSTGARQPMQGIPVGGHGVGAGTSVVPEWRGGGPK